MPKSAKQITILQRVRFLAPSLRKFMCELTHRLSRVLDFTEFMDQEIKQRIRSGVLEWMDKVNIFEGFYIPKRES